MNRAKKQLSSAPKKNQTKKLTGMSTAEDPGMVGLGRVPGIEAGIGCLCRLCRCSSEDRDPGTGLGEQERKLSRAPETKTSLTVPAIARHQQRQQQLWTSRRR